MEQLSRQKNLLPAKKKNRLEQQQQQQQSIVQINFLLTSVRGTRIKGCRFGLRDFLDLAIKLTGRGLVKSNFFFHTHGSDCIQHSKDTNTVRIRSVLGHVKGNLYVTHGSEIVNFGGSDLRNDGNEICGIA